MINRKGSISQRLCRYASYLGAALAMASSGLATASAEPYIHIKLDEPTFVLPRFADPFMERESGIAPHEYEFADRLRQLIDAGDKQAALQELNVMFELELSPALLHLKGQVYFVLEEYEEAEKAFEMVLLRVPQFVRAHSDIGQLYLVTDRPEKARDHFAKAVSYGENNPAVYGQLGYLNLKLHNAQSAISMYQNALAIEPSNIQWQQGLLSALSKAGLYGPATSFTAEMLRAQPENSSLWLNKAFLHLRQDQRFEALASLETSIALGESEPANKLAATQLHLELGSFDRALQLLDDCIAANAVDLDTITGVATALERSRRWKDLSALLKRYEAANTIADTQQSNYQLLQARVAKGMGRSDLAAAHYRKALNADPTNTAAIMSAANHFYERKQYIEAESLYARAEAFDETHKDAILGRARIYVALEDYESALGAMREARAAYPNEADIARNVSILESALAAREVESSI